MVIRVNENKLDIEKCQSSERFVAFLQTHKQIVEVTETEQYYIIAGSPSNLYFFLINAARQFSIELF